MAIFNIRFRVTRWPFAALLAIFASAASAGPGFIANSRVSSDENGARIEIRFNCKATYQQHEPQTSGDRLRIFLEPTGICNGVSPIVAQSRGRFRPANADSARLIDFEYDGDSGAGSVLTLNFSEPVAFLVDANSVDFELLVQVRPTDVQAAAVDSASSVLHRQVIHDDPATPDVAINLASFRRIPTVADVPSLEFSSERRIYYAEVDIDGTVWYRLKLGNFSSADAAQRTLNILKPTFPEAWIDQVDVDAVTVDLTVAARESFAEKAELIATAADGDSEVDALMLEARQMMVAGETSRAVQLYTKVLRMPEHPRQAEAQEFLALAREKNGQTAHAKAEYQRYLSLYPDSEGAARVSQRLAALLATNRLAGKPVDVAAGESAPPARAAKQSDWRLQTFFSQYYRRDANQQNDQNEIVSQSALYSDVNVDARRRGKRFDFSSRLSAGYRNDFLDEGFGSGNETRISYAYADIADAKTGLRGRIGRQSRNTGGVLGRFDGLNLGYQAGERILINAVVGSPAYSASDGIDSARSFYGASVNYGPLFDGLDLGLFYIQQEIEGIDDRQAVGGEFRYFGANQSFWGLIDYDMQYEELGSAFLQGSWRFGSRLTVHGSFDQRHSPFLSMGNALIGQPVLTFAELLEIYPIDEIRQFGLDRSPLSTTYTVGLSHTLSPKLQISVDANQTTVEATPESGGVFATPETTYSYLSTNFVASSLIKEGDVTILSLRYSDSETTQVMSMTLDSRFPFGRTWRINPRLRVDRRERIGANDFEWIYTPGIRIQYRRNQKFRVELEAGKQFAQRDLVDANIDRESYFINFGYQAFF